MCVIVQKRVLSKEIRASLFELFDIAMPSSTPPETLAEIKEELGGMGYECSVLPGGQYRPGKPYRHIYAAVLTKQEIWGEFPSELDAYQAALKLAKGRREE